MTESMTNLQTPKTQNIGNEINIIPDNTTQDIVVKLPAQTEVAKNLYTTLSGRSIIITGAPSIDRVVSVIQLPIIREDGNLAIPAKARPPAEIFGDFDKISAIKDGDIESRMYRKSKLNPDKIARIYIDILHTYRSLINTFTTEQATQNLLSAIEEVAVPNFINPNAIIDFGEDYENTYQTIEEANEIDRNDKDWKGSKTRIRGFIAKLMVKAKEKKEGKQTTISKTQLEITKHLKWILAGVKHKPLGATAQSIMSYAQDVLIPHLAGQEVFDQDELNTNFFSIGQFWSYKDEIGRPTYTPLTVNNLDTGYLPHSLEVRLLLDAIKNCGPRLVDIQSTYGLLLPAIKNSIHAKALNQGGMNYNRPKVEDQIRITLNTLLEGLLNDLNNDFKEEGAKNMKEQKEILNWVLGLFKA